MPTTDRRRLLGAGVAGTVLAAFGAQRASASSGSSTTASSDSTEPSATNAATTTAPPGPPTTEDKALLAFILTAELAASELYGVASEVDGIDDAAATLYAVLEEHHLAYANNIAGRLGKAALNVANASLVEEFEADMSGPDATTRGRELERMLVATHLDAVGRLEGIDAAQLLAAIVVVEGQHIAALAALDGLDPDADYAAYVTETADPMTSDDYPALA